MNLDFSFLSWDVLTGFVLKGLVFSMQLTLVAMIGGIALGTVLALMRLSGKKWLVMPAATAARQITRAVARRRREVVVTGSGRLAVWLERHAPWLVALGIGRAGLRSRRPAGV